MILTIVFLCFLTLTHVNSKCPVDCSAVFCAPVNCPNGYIQPPSGCQCCEQCIGSKGDNCDGVSRKCASGLKCNMETNQCECAMNCSLVRCNMYPNCKDGQQQMPIDTKNCYCCPYCA